MASTDLPLNDVLGPAERVAEITFGVLMAMTMTTAVDIETDGPTGMRTLIVDGVMYLVNAQMARNQRHKVLAELQAMTGRPPAISGALMAAVGVTTAGICILLGG